MRKYNHGPFYRRPLWVNIWLRRIYSRTQGIVICCICVVAGTGLGIYGFRDPRFLGSSALLLFGSFWTSLAIWWVDQYDYWD